MRRTDNDMYRQYAQETADNERLRRENASLRAENIELRRRVKTFEDTLEERIAELETAVAVRDAEISRLKAQISKDSSNSSAPPSQNGFKRSQARARKPVGKRAVLPELVEKGKAQHVVIDDTNGAQNFDISWGLRNRSGMAMASRASARI